MIPDSPAWKIYMQALAVGAIAFAVIVPFQVLSPSFTLWLSKGDPSTNYLGWEFFKNDVWRLPPGYNPNYGLDIASGIFYSDSIPLLCLPVKLIRAFLPDPFQFFGIWIAMAFMLQSVSAARSGLALGLPSNSVLALSILCTFFPPLIWRLHGHFALLGQFLILESFTAYIKRKGGRICWWHILICISALVHSYLLVMVLVIWAASLLSRGLEFKGLSALVLECIAGLIVAVVSLWMSGFFTIGSGWVGGSYGSFGIDLLAMFDSRGWSWSIPALSNKNQNFEGFGFVGLGVFVLLGSAVVNPAGAMAGLRKIFSTKWMPLALVLLGMVLFAISNHVLFNQNLFVDIPMPEWFYRPANILRASGRMSWPALYALVLFLGVSAHKAKDKKFGSGVLLLAATFQIFDTSKGWLDMRAELQRATQVEQSVMLSPLWSVFGQHYRSLRYAPISNQAPRWEEVARIALKHQLSTDSVYLARVDTNNLARAERNEEETLLQGGWEMGTLYIVREELRERFKAAAKPEDFFGEIDGFWVFAPGGSRLVVPSSAINQKKCK